MEGVDEEEVVPGTNGEVDTPVVVDDDGLFEKEKGDVA